MKEAKYIKNMFYKTIYKTSEDKYKDAVIAFTTVRYDDKSREELVTLNKIENDISYNEGNIAYHCRSGIHDLTVFDWNKYIEYFKKIVEN